MTVAIPHYFPVKNAATTSIPPFGIMAHSDDPADSGHLTVNQPTECSCVITRLLINDAVTIPREPYGFGQGHRTFPAVVAYEEADGVPAYAETWGPMSGSWKLRKEGQGFYILGGASRGLVNVTDYPPPSPRMGYEPVRLWQASRSSLPTYTRSDNTITFATGASQVVDSVTTVAGDRIGLNQDCNGHIDCGIWTVKTKGVGAKPFSFNSWTFRARTFRQRSMTGPLGASGGPTQEVWIRACDADSSDDFKSGYLVAVSEGTRHKNSFWMLTTDDPITLNTTAIEFHHQDGQKWLCYENHTGGTVPAFGCIPIVGTVSSTSDVLYAYTQESMGPLVEVAFNSPSTVTNLSMGACTMDFPATVLYDSADGTPSEGELWGPVYNSYKLRKNTSGPSFRVIGKIDTTNKLMLVTRHQEPVYGATLRRTATQAIPNATWTAISWDTVDADNADTPYYAAGTPTYLTIPFTGEYRITVNVSFENSAAGSYRGILIVDTDSTGASDIRERGGHDAAPTAALPAGFNNTARHKYSCTVEQYFLATRRVYVYVVQNSGGNLNIGGIGGGDKYHTSISIRRVGAGMIA